MKLEENNIIVKRSYKTVYKCDDSIVKVFNEEHPKSDVFNEALIDHSYISFSYLTARLCQHLLIHIAA